MTDNVYIVVTALTSGSTLVFGLCFLLLHIPESTFLHGYRIARKTAAVAYLGVSLLCLMEVFFHNPDMNDPLSKSVKLFAGSLQALFFTYTFISLISPGFVTRKKIAWEIAIILAFVSAVFISYALAENSVVFDISYFSYIVYYLVLLIRYLVLFLKEYRTCFNKADNYYSGEEAQRFRWIYYSFIGMFSIGVMLVFILIFSEYGILFSLFTLSYGVVYSVFGIGFIDYVYRYQIIESLSMTDGNIETLPESNSDKSMQIEIIREALNVWVSEEKFLRQGLTIEDLSAELNTNRTYLSAYINQVKQKSFRSWINNLKIGKAQELLLNHPEMLVVEVADLAGYTDSSNFNKQFVKITGSSAKIWRNRQLAQSMRVSKQK